MRIEDLQRGFSGDLHGTGRDVFELRSSDPVKDMAVGIEQELQGPQKRGRKIDGVSAFVKRQDRLGETFQLAPIHSLEPAFLEVVDVEPDIDGSMRRQAFRKSSASARTFSNASVSIRSRQYAVPRMAGKGISRR